ncbi:MAG: branched-chain amino acid ABC transporter permease [Acetobacteraceae bacterium]|nr:branched-chain amino acid ABC transporter permease [Acetobacteraceae bacterium]
MPSASALLSQAFNGLALGTLLALVSSGLTIILGTLGVLNFAHGALFMVGAYILYIVAAHTGSFLGGLLAGSVFMLVAGVLLERGLIRWFYARPPEDQILVTFGAAIVIVEAVRAIFGPDSQHVDVPAGGHPTRVLDLSHLPAAADRHRGRAASGPLSRPLPHLHRPCGPCRH